jgi:hypothetical protein
MSIKATKTEYNGIVFRSKSEAIFARMLDQLGYRWEYEPEYFQVGSYTPDFWVCAPLMCCVVEYKPAEPTQAYKDKLFDIFTSEKYRLVHGVLVYASPFDIDAGFHAIRPNTELEEEKAWIGAPFTGTVEMRARLSDAKEYRFDLRDT